MKSGAIPYAKAATNYLNQQRFNVLSDTCDSVTYDVFDKLRLFSIVPLMFEHSMNPNRPKALKLQGVR